ncbi:hypothetical protein SJ_140 [Proteus phage SJ_PmiM]|nr:hypothetical protein SJ_140 [Proteus phage SJ_PmiM]
MLIDTLINVKDKEVNDASKSIFEEIKSTLLFRSKTGHKDLNWTLGEISFTVQETMIGMLKAEGLKVKRTEYDSNVINISGW